MKQGETAEPRVGQHDKPELDRQYGKIGIPAVAAAVRYQSDSKNLAYAPAPVRIDDWTKDIAA